MNLSMRELLEAGAHFGHRTRYWNPKMEPYIFGSRNNIHIINLEKTLPMLGDASNYIGKLASNRAKILFVGTKRAAQESIREQAKRCGMPYVDYRLLGGMLTNYKTIRLSIKRLKELEETFAKGEIEGLTKKEKLTLMREKDKLSRGLEGIKEMGGLPDALFVVDVGFEHIAVNEAKKLGSPVIGIVDTNNSPEDIDYIIPGNDDAIRAIRFYSKTIADSILTSKSTLSAIPAEKDQELSAESTTKRKASGKRKVITKSKPVVTTKKKSGKKVELPDEMLEEEDEEGIEE